MKTFELKLLPTPVLLVWELPEDAKVTDNNAISHRLPKCGVMHYTHLTDGNWQLIGKLSELTEEQAQELDKGVPHHTTGKQIYRDHTYYTVRNITNNGAFETALESFHSAIQAEGYFLVNPYSEPIYTTNHSDDCYCKNCEKETKRCADLQVKVRKAQSKVLPANTLIFKRGI